MKTSRVYSPAQPLLKFTHRSKSSDIDAQPHWCLEVQTVEMCTSGNESGFSLHTVRNNRAMTQNLNLPSIRNNKNPNLETYLSQKLIPTPGANEFKGAGRDRFLGSKAFRGAKASEAFRTSSTDPIYLSPYFAEWLMNYPPGASNYKPLAMDKIPLSWQPLTRCSAGNVIQIDTKKT